MAQPRFAPTDSRGNAERLLFQGPQKYRAEQVNYTTCGPGNDDWYIRARELDIDTGRDVGVARGASIVFMDHTILYTPYLSFSLHQQRKSGILAPHYGTSNTSGAELTVPYYWNIAPNYDATFFPAHDEQARIAARQRIPLPPAELHRRDARRIPARTTGKPSAIATGIS